MSMPKRRRLYKGDTSKRRTLYTPVKSGNVPGSLLWKRSGGRPSTQVIVEYTRFGNLYKRVTDTRARTVTYYRLLQEPPPATPAEQIDAEPPKPPSGRYKSGVTCWFVDTDARWYLCVVTARSRNTITIRPVNGQDDTREKPWPYGTGELEFSVWGPIFKRLRPLKARKT